MNNAFTICFYGSSDHELQQKLANLYKADVDVIIDKVLNIKTDNIKIITGGYGGIMDLIAGKIQYKKSLYAEKNIEIIGITCDAYDFENPAKQKYNASNDYSQHNDVIIQAKNFADRIQAMIELSDLFIVLPGKQGSLSELLLTCESYAFGAYILNGKKAKLFVHDYWQPLLTNEIVSKKTQISYFRNFDTNVLEYFNKETIETKLSSLIIERTVINNIEGVKGITNDAPDASQHLKQDEYIPKKFGELKNDINKAILGRLIDTDGKKILKRLNKNDNSILGLDFGWFLTNKVEEKDGGYFSYSTEEYRNHNKTFFESHNSIMLGEINNNNEFQYSFLNGKLQNETVLTLESENTIPKKGEKENGDFLSLKKYFECNLYGQTLIWRGFKVTLGIGFSDEIIFSVFLLLNHKIPHRKIEKIRQLIDDFLLVVSSRKSGELFKEKDDTTEKHALKAAIAEIINRNYAHHIGSHVSHRATFEEILLRLGLKPGELVGNQLASIAQMRSRLEKYKDERSEFIASISGSIFYQSFNFFTEIIRPFIENTLILDTIAANEGIRYFDKDNPANKTLPATNSTQSQLIIRVFIHKDLTSKQEGGNGKDKNGRNDLSAISKDYLEQRVVYYREKRKTTKLFDSVSVPYYLETSDLQNPFYEIAEPLLEDIQVNMPGPLGKHAIYSMLENYIRNTAKHAYKQDEHKDQPVEIILKLSPDGEDDKIKFDITDNISNATNEIVERLCNNLRSDLKDKNGMGIADMKITACLLAEKDLTEENLKSSLKVSASEEKHLVYTMQLSRPKQIALIGCNCVAENKREGIYTFDNIGAYIDAPNRSFQFAIIEATKENLDAIIQENKHLLPLRLFVCVGDKASDNSENPRYVRVSKNELCENEKNLLQFCWKEWTAYKVGNTPTELSVYLEQKKDEYPTDKWKKVSENFQTDKDSSFTLNVPDTKNQTVANDKRVILYDRHAGLLRKTNNKKFITDNFWELIDKQNPDFDLIYSTNPESKHFVLPYEMLDAALNKVLIIDERVAEVANKRIDNAHQNEILKKGFQKYTPATQITLFDYCWAAGVYVCTHLNGKPVHSNNNKANSKSEHFLDVYFTKNNEKVDVGYITNFIEFRHQEGRETIEGQRIPVWKNKNSGIKSECDFQSIVDLKIKFDCLLIHRTKLKELIDKGFGMEFISQLAIPKIYIITGGGVVDFLSKNEKSKGKESKITILPTNILKDFIMNGRISKLALNKILK